MTFRDNYGKSGHLGLTLRWSNSWENHMCCMCGAVKLCVCIEDGKYLMIWVWKLFSSENPKRNRIFQCKCGKKMEWFFVARRTLICVVLILYHLHKVTAGKINVISLTISNLTSHIPNVEIWYTVPTGVQLSTEFTRSWTCCLVHLSILHFFHQNGDFFPRLFIQGKSWGLAWVCQLSFSAPYSSTLPLSTLRTVTQR